MTGVDRAIQIRQLQHFHATDPAYGAGIAAGLGIDMDQEVLVQAAE